MAKSFASTIPPLVSDVESALNAVATSLSASAIDDLDAKKGFFNFVFLFLELLYFHKSRFCFYDYSLKN